MSEGRAKIVCLYHGIVIGVHARARERVANTLCEHATLACKRMGSPLLPY